MVRIQSRVGQRQAEDARPSGKGPAAGEESGARKLSLPDAVSTRLKLQAIKTGSTASAIAAEILDRNLPRLRIAVDD